ncbi:O-antigen ligase family protein [uncultured Aquimarina sp.]|uniref:O-antigen ligase family protein n=1 Tax=uncultured Aquimarina sp. TaxID=575652 RepID=UPI00260EF022|nr:O-antigen ligase family protein [uncultured Aquimarina sp.]
MVIKVYLGLFCVLLFSLPFSDVATSLPNIILVALSILFPFCFNASKIEDFKNQTVYTYLILTLYLTFNFLVFGNIKSEISQHGKFFLPIALFILSVPLKKYSKELKIALILGVFLAVIISLGSIFIFIHNSGNFNFSSGKEINEVLILERVYIAFFCVLSFILSLDLLQSYKKLILINISVLLVFVFMIAARIALITIVLVAFLYIVKTLDRRRILVILSLGVLLIAGFFMVNKNLQNRFFYKNHNNSFIESLAIWEPRMVIWPCVYNITKKDSYNYISGLASFDSQEKQLLQCYERSINHEEKRKWFLFIKYNTHNQFLDFLLVSGVLGLIFFVLVFGITLWKNKRDFFSISLVIAFVFLGLVENYLHRQVGVYCFGIFLILLLKKQKKII